MQNNQLIDFTLIYNRHKKQLYNYVLKITRSSMIAEDIVHNVFIKLYDNISTLRDTDKIEYWIFSTARNEAFSYFRKIKTRQEEDLENCELQPSAEDPSVLFEQNELREIIQTELNRMHSDQREVYILKEFSGMSYKEVASVMSISEDLVKSRLHKVRQRLKCAILKLGV
ncbi:MAG: RNA polymerase sigma factor [Bacillota bacterium]